MKNYTIFVLLYVVSAFAQNNDKSVIFDPYHLRSKIFVVKRNMSYPKSDGTQINIKAIARNYRHAYLSPADENNEKSDPMCYKSIAATIGLANSGNITPRNKIIVVNHVLDEKTGKKSLLLNPYVIMFRQDPLEQLYGLQYRGDVNGEAKEEVINKRNPGFRGCDDSSEMPTCGRLLANGKYIPYSEGFCCSCDEVTNKKRAQETYVGKYEEQRSGNNNMFRQMMTKVGLSKNDDKKMLGVTGESKLILDWCIIIRRLKTIFIIKRET